MLDSLTTALVSKILTLQYAPLLSQRTNVRTSSDMCGICHHRKHVLLAFIIFICYFLPLLFLLLDRFEMCAFWLKEISFFLLQFWVFEMLSACFQNRNQVKFQHIHAHAQQSTTLTNMQGNWKKNVIKTKRNKGNIETNAIEKVNVLNKQSRALKP